MRSGSRLPFGFCFALGVATALACNDHGHDREDDNQFRRDVLWCEEAIARLARCCPNFDGAEVDCRYYYSYDSGCGTTTTTTIEPALAREESRCIRETSCEALVAQGVCERVKKAGAARESVITTGDTSSSGSPSSGPSRSTYLDPVCP